MIIRVVSSSSFIHMLVSPVKGRLEIVQYLQTMGRFACSRSVSLSGRAHRVSGVDFVKERSIRS
jgi:hypothetical protein